MRLSRALPAGVVDAGFASLATFGMALYASTTFPVELLGAYALFFTAFVAVAVLPTQLLFIPAEVEALARPGKERLSVVAPALRLAAGPVAGFALLTAGTVLVMPAEVTSSQVTAFTVTAVALAVLSPVQDHVRRVLHLAGLSWSAAAVSAVQFGGIVAAIVALVALGVEDAWIPFGSLAAANVCSLSAGLVVVRRHRDPAPFALRLDALVRSGRWLLVVGASPAAGGFIASALVSALAGAAALGHAEAARVVAQPVLVLATGLQAVIGPRSMEAGMAGDRAKAGRHARVFMALVALGAALYAALVGFDTGWNPAARLVPEAYAVAALVMLTIVANVAFAAGMPPMAELIGGRREVSLAGVESLSGAARAATAGAAGWLGAYAVPWAFLASGIVRYLGYRPIQRSLYAGERAVAATGGGAAG